MFGGPFPSSHSEEAIDFDIHQKKSFSTKENVCDDVIFSGIGCLLEDKIDVHWIAFSCQKFSNTSSTRHVVRICFVLVQSGGKH